MKQSMNDICTPEKTASSFLYQLAGCIYILLMMCGFSFPHRLLLCDIVFPVFFCIVAKDIFFNIRSDFRKHLFLYVFLGLSLLSVLIHSAAGGAFLPNIFEWSVYFYGAVIFFYFSRYSLPDRTCLWLGSTILSANVLAWITGIVVYLFDDGAAPVFWEVYGKLADSDLPFLARRFSFTFDNPNLAAPFCSLAALMTAVGLKSTEKKWPYIFLLCAGFAVVATTLSKHGILYLAVLMFLCGDYARNVMKIRWARGIMLSGLAAVILAFELTVLFVVFPLKSTAPFINTVPGMYNIHHRAYAKMITEAAPFGMSVENLRKTYPEKVDVESAVETLKYYNSEDIADTFCTYMDPHCEWLNLPVLFGLPALLFMLAFLVQRAGAGPLALFWCAAVLGTMFWDDVLSKRWIWLGLAISGNVCGVIFKNGKSKNEVVQQGTSVD